MLTYVVHGGQSYMQDFGILYIVLSQIVDYQHGRFLLSCLDHPADAAAILFGRAVTHFFVDVCNTCRCLTGPIPLVMDSCVMCQFVLWRRVNESNMNVISVPIMVLAMLSEAYGLHNFTAE